jgi:hypothetical protein
MSLRNCSRFLILICASLISVANAANENSECPAAIMNQTENLPTCPEGGLVPETYPVGALVVSDIGNAGPESGFAAEVVTKSLMATGENNPLIILPVTDSTMDRVRTRIDELPISETLKEKYKKSLVQIKSGSYTWQQDYMQPFVDPKTGKIVLREVDRYSKMAGRGRLESSVKDIVSLGKACGFTQGPPLITSGEELPSGAFGGNIETLPSGICLLGDDNFKKPGAWEEYANQVCNQDPENRIQVPTSWLAVGHTDEVMKLVRNKNGKAPCDFSVAIANPDKALELLRKNPKEVFLDFSNIRGVQTGSLTKDRINQSANMLELCKKVRDLRQNSQPDAKSRSEGGVSKIFQLESLLFTHAQAGAFISGPSFDLKDCENMTNDEVYRVYSTDPALKVYNQLVQEKMDALKLEVTKKLKAKLPQCETDFIDFPNLFSGGIPVEVEPGKNQLPKAMGGSLLPNPTNAISINDTVISPSPSNASFKKFMQDEYSKRGLKSEFIDTYEYSHVKGGNLHCTTNTFHICKPRGAK